ncbi:MAG TPA: biosynthetic peptidoglycan transglycosylase [Gaiellaceae bacterium]|nr:biosynthetic peptidoglycan transglycosylase [Gaiellaceae bacterium]
MPVVAALAAGAWLTSPSAVSLASHVDARLRRSNATAVPLTAVAPIMREAVVATEDERFYRHHGVDVIGVLRTLPYDLVHLTFAQGASTITEQVAKLLYLHGNDHTPWRKLEDAAVAFKLEDRYDKERILDAYLNSVYFGEGAYGVKAASEHYFGVLPRSLGAADASLLAGLIQAPSAYDPSLHPRSARERQLDVLRSLVRDGLMTNDAAAAAVGRSLRLRSAITLPPVRGIDFRPGPAFVWWELTLGLAIGVCGAGVLVASRVPRFRVVHGLVAIRALAAVLALVGAATVVRSFRAA